MRRLSVLLACVVMALTLIAFAVATGVSAAPKQQTASYGAVDVAQATGKFYYGSGPSKDAANQAAYDACTKAGATDCVTEVWVYNGYIALAESSKFHGWGWGATKEEASNAAVRNCEANGAPPCKLVDYLVKTATDPNKQTTGGYELPGP
jgi:Domain of unknown function (DUF4189)